MRYLFDFDGTILEDNIYPPQAIAIKLALFESHEVPIRVPEQMDWVGKTDLQIAREAVFRARGSATTFDQESFMQSYVPWFDKLMERKLDMRFGMREVLEGCGQVRLVTGNVAPVALAKIIRTRHLIGLIDVGKSAFGELAESRAGLLRFALGEEGPEDAVYVGDTWRDIAAAKEVGVQCVGLVTPKHPEMELVEADWVVRTPDELLRVLKENVHA